MLDNKILLENIKKLCDSKGIKITNLEKELGFGGGIISRWGNNADPSLSKIIDIADYFHVTLDEVVGRNNTIGDDFLKVLYDKTVNKEIQWKNFDITEDESGLKQYYDNTEHDFCSKEEYDYFCETHKEISYYFEYVSGFISIYAMYKYHEVTTPDEIKLFIQPDIQAELIPQQYNSNELLPLWLKVLTSLGDNAPDEIKAADFKQQILFLNSQPKIKIGTTGKIPQSEIERVLSENEMLEIQQLIQKFSQPEMAKAINTANELVKYLHNNETEPSRMVRLLAESVENNNNKRAGD